MDHSAFVSFRNLHKVKLQTFGEVNKSTKMTIRHQVGDEVEYGIEYNATWIEWFNGRRAEINNTNIKIKDFVDM